ncbi:helix-turn-helix transcriptional regulator [Nonomuraea sp. NPDC049504]|uniref:helix-turn-helix transcriptional regulator n=1 Tax=Nonomuraea sp. NPDC049504 TaxID=3154729 RepID=UPI00344124B7
MVRRRRPSGLAYAAPAAVHAPHRVDPLGADRPAHPRRACRAGRAAPARRRRSRAVPGRPAEGWDSLTASELRIVLLVAGGATNKQVADQLFLSPHTVGTHLWRAFTKLGISSRVELTRLVLEHDTA